MMRTIQTARRGGLIVALAMLTGSVWVEGGQAPATPQAPGTLPNFTGTVASIDASNVRASRFRYEAGARSYWHCHDGDLVLLIEQGRGRARCRARGSRNSALDNRCSCRPACRTGTGPRPTKASLGVACPSDRTQKWMGPVSDEEYRGTK